MKKIWFSLLHVLSFIIVFAQQNDFEGILVYRNDVKSKMQGISDKTCKTMLVLDDSVTVYIKQGNYRRSSRIAEEYYISKKQKAYMKFKGIDTLFYTDYSSDTAAVTEILRPGERKTIADLECQSIVIKTDLSTSKFFYSTSLYMNPEYDRNNKIGRHDVYTKETSSIWLSHQQETANYQLSQICGRIEQRKIDETVFELPKLPEKKFSPESIIKPAAFSGSGGWIKYLQANLNAKLGAKYIKIPKGENDATEIVRVTFLVSERGEILDAKVLNKDDVHPKLAEEALRVITQSYGWKPASLLGQKIPYRLIQPITFYVIK